MDHHSFRLVATSEANNLAMSVVGRAWRRYGDPVRDGVSAARASPLRGGQR